jgi:hypothetical protein
VSTAFLPDTKIPNSPCNKKSYAQVAEAAKNLPLQQEQHQGDNAKQRTYASLERTYAPPEEPAGRRTYASQKDYHIPQEITAGERTYAPQEYSPNPEKMDIEERTYAP